MLNLYDVLFSLVVIFILLALVYGTGYIIQIALGRTQSNVFEHFFTGSLLLTSLGAIMVTKGLTVLFPVPFLLVLYILKRKPDIPTQIKKGREILLFIILSTLCVFFFYLFGLISISGAYVKYISGDFSIYFRAAEQINRLGIENNQLNSIYPPDQPAPYHFGDIWLFAMVARWVSHNPSVIFLVSLVFLYVTFVTGLYCYLDDKFQPKDNRKWLYLVLFSGLFSGFSWFFPRFILSADVYSFSILNYPKVLLPGCFIVWALMHIRRKDWLGLSIVTAIAALNFINIAPTFCLALFFILMLNMLSGDLRVKSGIGYLSLVVIVLGIAVVVLYLLVPHLSAANTIVHEQAAGVFNMQAYIVRGIKIFFGGLLQLTTITPFVLLFGAGAVFLRRKPDGRRILNENQDIVFLLLLLISSLLCWSVFHPVVADAVQFYVNILYVFYAIVITLILMYLAMVVRQKLLICLALIGVSISLYNNYNYTFSVSSILKKDWNLVSAYLAKNENGNFNFANVRPLNNFSSLFDKNTQGFIPLTIISYLDPGYSNVSLNAPFINIEESGLYAKEEKKLIETAPFTMFYKQYISLHPEYDPQSAIPAFLKEYDIHYVSVHDTLIPEILSPYITDSVSCTGTKQKIYTISIK